MPKRPLTAWTEGVSLPQFPKLSESLRTDVVVIGGGIAGILTAYHLAKQGRKVVLLERNRLLSGATADTTAFITQSIDTDTPDLIEMFGKEGTRLIYDSHGAARDFIAWVAKEEGIECDFKRVPNHLYANDRKELKQLKEEYAAMQAVGIRANLSTAPLSGFANAGAIVMPNQAKYHPLRFLAGVVEKLKELEVQIYEMSEATAITRRGSVQVTVGSCTVTADWSVMATYETDNRYKELYFKKGMYKSYVLELEAPHGVLTEGIYEDMDNPYHYFRVDPGEIFDRIILGGEDHRIEVKMNEKKSFDSLHAYAREIFGTTYPELRRWTGPVLEPIDGLALIGEVAPRQLVASAFSGNGMTYGAISALLLTDIILGKRNPWRTIYDPKRMPDLTQLWKKGRDYTEEFFRGAVANALKSRKR